MAIGKVVGSLIAVCAVGMAQTPTSAPQPHPRQTIQTGRTVRHDRTVDNSLNNAEAALGKQDYATAEPLLEKIVENDAKNFRAWYDLGFLYSATGRKQQSIEAYRKSVAAKPDVFESNMNLGLLLAQQGSPEAEKYLRAATALKPGSNPNQNLEQAWMALGNVLRQNNPPAATQAFAKAAELQPTDPQPSLAAARLAENTKDYAAAESAYRAAAERDPRSVEAAAGLANVYMETQRPTEAEKALRNYLAVIETPASGSQATPSMLASAHMQLGRVLLQLHRRDEAIAEFEEAAKLAPTDDASARELAWLYLQDKQYGKAETSFRQLLQGSPDDADVHHGLGEALIQEKKFPEAQQELLTALKLKPNLGDAYGDLAFAASENQNYTLTVKALEARQKFLKDTPGTLFLRATALDHLGDRKNAAASYREFLAVSNGRFPDQEWQAKHRLVAIDPQKK